MSVAVTVSSAKHFMCRSTREDDGGATFLVSAAGCNACERACLTRGLV